MADLRSIEQRLNSDPQYRAAFLKDPVSVLLGAGLVLSPQNAQLLRQRVAALQNAGPAVPGSAVRSQTQGVMWTATHQHVGSSAAGPVQARPIRLVLMDNPDA